jgi:hypothetical protein
MKHERLKHVSPLPTNFSPKTGQLWNAHRHLPLGSALSLFSKGNSSGVYAKSCRNSASPACQTTHVCDPTEAYSISNHTGNGFAFALLLRKPRLGWAGVGLNLTSGARVAQAVGLNWIF